MASQNCPDGGGAEQGGMLCNIPSTQQTKQFSQNGCTASIRGVVQLIKKIG